MNTTFKISIQRTIPTAPQGAGSLLNSLLADEYVLSLATRNYYWNATGADAPRLRQMFETQLRDIDGRLDRLAWQIGTLGDCARLGPTDLVAAGRPTIVPGAGLDSQAMLARLSDLHDEMIVRLKSAVGMATDRIGDAGTAKLLGDLLVLRERDAWMLRALRWDLAAYHDRDGWMLPATPWNHRVAAVA